MSADPVWQAYYMRRQSENSLQNTVLLIEATANLLWDYIFNVKTGYNPWLGNVIVTTSNHLFWVWIRVFSMWGDEGTHVNLKI